MKQKIRKELREWLLLIIIAGMVYLMGWHTEIIGRLQQLILTTGIITPDYVDNNRVASYDFWVENTNGEKIHFSDFKDQVVFINFWATWCPPCIAEMPDIHDLYLETKDRVTFAIISLDNNRDKAREFLEKKGFEFPVYFLASSLPQSYDTHAIPTTYLLDHNGQIKVENQGMAKYNTERFKNLLNRLSERTTSP